MEKPFDLKVLEERLKAKGMPVVEGAAKLVVEEVLQFVQESVVLTENKYDDLALAIIPALKPFIMKEVDKIDGEVSA